MKNKQKIILHLITGLNTGGAENMLKKLLCRQYDYQYKNVVISLTDSGTYGSKLQEHGVELHLVHMNKMNPFFSLITLFKLIKGLRPDLIVAWMSCMLHRIFNKIQISKNTNNLEYTSHSRKNLAGKASHSHHYFAKWFIEIPSKSNSIQLKSELKKT